MKKPSQVVMLSTNEKAKIGDIVMSKFDDIHILTKNDGKEYAKTVTSQHLYILSDEEIKEGDWYLVSGGVGLKIGAYKSDGNTPINDWCKKIIATTDSSIKIVYDGKTPISENWNGYLLPQPSQSFIDKFVEEYNYRGDVITEVMVEYESIGAYANPKYDSDYQLKINSDNTINISNSKV